MTAVVQIPALSERQQDLLRRWAYTRQASRRDEVSGEVMYQASLHVLEQGLCWWQGTERCLVMATEEPGPYLALHFVADRGGLQDVLAIVERFIREDWPQLGCPEIRATNNNRALRRVIRSLGARLAGADVEFREPTPGSFVWRTTC